MKTVLFIFLVTLLSSFALAQVKTSELKIVEKIKLKQIEVSGLAWRNADHEEKKELIAIGDRKYEVGILNWKNRAKAEAYQNKSDFKENAGLKKHSQWEAVASDGSGQIYALQESGKFFVVAPDGATVKNSFKLSIPKKLKKELEWSTHSNSGAEGLLLLKNGHLLVLKEKSPIQVIEFAPTETAKPEGYRSALMLGAKETFSLPSKDPELVAIKHWALDPSQSKLILDASEMATGKAGELYFLSDESALIARIPELSPTQSTFKIDRTWKLPLGVHKDDEGLVIDEKNRPVIARDKRSVQENVFILSPLD